MQPRNTLVTVAPIKDAEQKQDNGIVIPTTTSQQYKECEVLNVGPGMVSHQEEISPCRDLKRGQTVLVHVQQRSQHGLQPIGVNFKTDDGREMVLVEQSQIVAILADPPKEKRLSLTE